METLERLIERLAPQAGERILDAGCGMGAGAGRLAAAGARVTGIDRLGVLLEQARYAHPECEFVEADLLVYTPAEPFDAILAHGLLSWVRPPERAARKMAELLKPGGRLAASLGGANESARELEAYYRPEAEEYAALLRRAGFTEAAVETWRPEVNGGTLLVSARRAG